MGKQDGTNSNDMNIQRRFGAFSTRPITATPTQTATPAPANGSTRYFYDDNGCGLCAPERRERGTMVKSVIDDIITYYPNSTYQVKTDGTHTNTRKYYTFNGAVVAMRENDTVTWLLQDQVSSTTITANADGSLASEVRYSAFGEIRASNGTTATDKKYTGQQQEIEISLDYYVARFYDPVTAHFVQADIIISNPFNSLNWDRYSYVINNPIRYNDPSGYRYCEEASNCGGTYIPSYSTIVNWIKKEFSWSISGDFTKKEVSQIYGAGSTIRSYVERSGGNGEKWIKKNLGYTVFEKNDETISQAKNLGAASFVWPYDTVRFGSDPVDYKLIIHELGHVLDNNQKGGIVPATVFGGGPADEMVRDLGGHPENNILRMKYGKLEINRNTFKISFQEDYQGYYDSVAGSSP